MAQSTGNKRVFLSALAALVLFQGCASAPLRNNPLPEDLADAAAVPGARTGSVGSGLGL